MKRIIITFLLLATVLIIGGCNHLPRGGAPREETVFNRFDRVQLMQSSSNEVLSFIQDKSMAELLSQDEQTLVSWGQKNDGAIIWLNAVSFDSDSDAAARKYAILIHEDSPGWKLFYGAKSEKMRAEFEFILPPEFDEIEVTTENTRRREALKSALGLYLMDTNNIRFDSDYIFSASMLLRQTFNQMLYELERVPARLSEIDSLEGFGFTHSTLGDARVRMLFDTDTYIVRIKLKVGGVTKSFAKHKDVIAMGEPVVVEAGDYPQAMAEDERERRSWLDWISTVGTDTPQRSAEEYEQIERMAQERADRELEQMRESQPAQPEVEPEPQQPEPEAVEVEAEPQTQPVAGEDNEQTE